MTERESCLFWDTLHFFEGDAKRAQHFAKVYFFAERIAEGERAFKKVAETVRAAAIVHDVGIRPAEEKYGRCDGKLQEQEGPAAAETLLAKAGYEREEIARICYLVGHHHTYSAIDGADFQILVEADLLVNFYEDGVSSAGIAAAVGKIFRTETGKKLAREMFCASV